MGLARRIVVFTLVLALALIGIPLPAHAATGEEAPVVRKNDVRCCRGVMRPRGPADIHGAVRSAPVSRSHDSPWAGDGRWAQA